MSRKRKELPLLEGVEIIDVAAEGNSLARVDEMVVFIPFGAPGDVADVKIDRKKRNYAEGHIERLVTPSSIRVNPPCEHFTICGGCRWQHLPYDFQLTCKQKQVKDCLDRIAKIPYPEITPILGSEKIWEYRNKMEYTFSDKMWLTFDQLKSGQEFPDRRAAGFHIPGAFDKVLDINKCHLQDDLGNRLRLFIKEFGKQKGYTFYNLRENRGFLRTLMIRIASTGDVMAVMSVGEDDMDKINELMEAISTNFPEVTSLFYVINTKVNDTIADLDIVTWKGKDYIEEEMEGLRFRVGPKSFYQTNSQQAYRLYSVAREFAGLTGSERVYDLYTGTGTIACFLARNAKHVIGIEYVPEAIEDAKVNAAANGLENTEFYAGDMKNVLTPQFIEQHGRPDVMIVDPPRAGMHEDVVKVILGAEPRRIVYVSCNPATQARDLAMLHEKYDITAVRPVDMFPHTQHVENVVAMELRGKND
ncbi:MAG: 23S rRNA (uracil(1939)-C(5))-methyltransferase RlmD [Muribaculaceae bacterium]|nr:23S rRNA (uracil(1939)-C(5))-methyltransferase RlmD [Muribaculaceae bacterium]